MRVAEILKNMAFGGGTAGLKIMGSFVFPGAWPIIEGALDPVIDRLKARLGVDDPFDDEHAHEAWSHLLTDDTLVARFEETLQLAVAPLRTSHEQLEEGQRRLLQILDGNAGILAVIQQDLDRMRTSGVTVAQPSVDAIRTAVGDEFAERVRGLEQRLDQLIIGRSDAEAARQERMRSRFRDQLARTQARAVELLNGREFDRAADELRSGIESLKFLIEEAPAHVDLHVNLAYYYKTIAATFASLDKGSVPASINQSEVVDEFNERAMTIFYLVAYGLPLDRKSARDHVHAVNGIGNIHYARGQYESAIEHCELAASIDPHYCYAWHDLFVAHYSLALRGHVNFPAMSRALKRIWETGQGQPGLGAKRLRELEHMLSTFDPDVIAERLIEEALRPLRSLREIAARPLPEPPEIIEDEVLSRALRTVRRGALQQAQEMLTALVDDFDHGRSHDARRAAVALCHLGSILAQTDTDRAYQHYARAVELAPAWADAWHDLGAILTQLDRSAEAACAFLRSAIQARANRNRTLLLFALENTASALAASPPDAGTTAVGIRMLRGLLYAYRSSENRDGLLRVYEKLAQLDIAMHNLDEAEHFAEIALELSEDNPVERAKFAWMLALLAEVRGRRAEALTRYQRVLLLLEETGPEELIQQAAAKIAELGEPRSSPP